MAVQTGNKPMSLNDLTMNQKIDFVLWLLEFPALTVLVFLRRRVGFRTLKPLRLFIMAMILCYLGNPNSHLFNLGERLVPVDFSTPLSMFGSLVLIVGLIQRWLRWREIRKGVMWHTYSRGVSYFEFLPLRIDHVYRYVDPTIAFIAGLFISQVPWFRGLGTWIVLSSFALFMLEQYIYDKQLSHDLDILDNLFISEVQSRTVEHFTRGREGEKAERTSLSDTAGIPTGVAADIAAQIDRRRRGRAAADGNGAGTDDGPVFVEPEYAPPKRRNGGAPDNLASSDG
jgi:hypothetical protein